jgi:hypothetical protein
MMTAVAVACIAPARATDSIPADLQAAIRLRAEAVAKKDGMVWDRLTTADFTAGLEDGRLQTIAARLTHLNGGRPEALPPKPLQELFPMHGSTVIQRTQGPDRSWIVSVWVKDGGARRVVAV